VRFGLYINAGRLQDLRAIKKSGWAEAIMMDGGWVSASC
jgi:hypothetical protein